MGLQVGRVAPGTAYTAGTDAVSVSTARDDFHVLTLAVNSAVTVIVRINGVDLLLNGGLALTADELFTFEYAADDQTDYTVRLGGNTTIRYLTILERRED